MTPKDVLVYISYGLILKRAYNWAHLKWDCAKLYATLTNCGNRLKLQLPSRGRNTRDGQGNDLGYGKNAVRCNNGQSAAKHYTTVCPSQVPSSTTRCWWGEHVIFLCVFLKIESIPMRKHAAGINCEPKVCGEANRVMVYKRCNNSPAESTSPENGWRSSVVPILCRRGKCEAPTSRWARGL